MRIRRLKAKKFTLHAILFGVGGLIYTSNILHHLKEHGVDSQRIQTALKLHACTLEKQEALKALVWSRKLLAPNSNIFH